MYKSKTKVKESDVIKVYQKKGCNVSATCTALGISRQTFYSMKQKSQKLAEELDAIDESMLDYAESKLMEHISDGDVTSLIFFLKTKGKKRGYVERTENDMSINGFENLMRSLPED